MIGRVTKNIQTQGNCTGKTNKTHKLKFAYARVLAFNHIACSYTIHEHTARIWQTTPQITSVLCDQNTNPLSEKWNVSRMCCEMSLSLHFTANTQPLL